LVVAGKSKCQKCLEGIKNHRLKLLNSGLCPSHPKTELAVGKAVCQPCLDTAAIIKLPIKARTEARKMATETRKARIDGTYTCPILGKTEKELRVLFPSKSNKSIWEFDHVNDLFRNIISGPANRIIKTFSSGELIKSAVYVRMYEV
jgi:hypothetical protein